MAATFFDDDGPETPERRGFCSRHNATAANTGRPRDIQAAPHTAFASSFTCASSDGSRHWPRYFLRREVVAPCSRMANTTRAAATAELSEPSRRCRRGRTPSPPVGPPPKERCRCISSRALRAAVGWPHWPLSLCAASYAAGPHEYRTALYAISPLPSPIYTADAGRASGNGALEIFRDKRDIFEKTGRRRHESPFRSLLASRFRSFFRNYNTT